LEGLGTKNLAHFVAIVTSIWYSYGHLVFFICILYQEKSGNPGLTHRPFLDPTVYQRECGQADDAFITFIPWVQILGYFDSDNFVPACGAIMVNTSRVTRLGEFWPNGQLFYLAVFSAIAEVAEIYELLFPRNNLCIDVLGYVHIFWAFFLKLIWSP
jgi:hypothetical protein